MLPPSHPLQSLFIGFAKRKPDQSGEVPDAKKPRHSARLVIEAQRKAYGPEINKAVVQLRQGASFSDSFRSRLRNPNDDALKRLVQVLHQFFSGGQRETLLRQLRKRLPKPKGEMTDPALRFNIFCLPVEVQKNILNYKLAKHPEIWQDTVESVFEHRSPADLSKKELRDLYLVTRHGEPLWPYSRTGSTVLTESLRGLKHKSLFDYFMRFAPRQLPLNQLDQYHLTALDTAVMTGAKSAVDTLLGKGERVTQQTLKQAALWGEPVILEKLLKQSEMPLTDQQVARYRERAAHQRQDIDSYLSQSPEERQAAFNQLQEEYLRASFGNLPVDTKSLKRQFAALAKAGVDLNRAESNWGYNALHTAVELDHPSILTTLLRAGAKVNQPNTDTQDSPLHLAVAYRRGNIIKALLRMNADANARNRRGETPLHMAAQKGEGEMFRNILSAGGNMMAEDEFGENMLHYAAQGGNPEVVALALNAGVAVNRGGQFGATPLATAAASGHLPVVELLLAHGANVDQKGQFGGTPIHCAARAGSLDIVNRLIAARASLDKRDSDGGTVLHCAVESGNIQLVERLLALGQPVDAESHDGSTPLHIAARRGDVPMIQRLLKAKAPVDKADRYGASPLYKALWGSNPVAINKLLDAGANVNHWEHRDLSIGVPATPFLYVLEHGDLNQVNRFLAAGGDVKVGEALVRASKNPDPQVTERLLALHAPKERKDGSGMNALHMAAFMGNVPVLKLLLKAGLSVNVRDASQGTALHWAAQGGSVEAVKELIKADVSVDQVNDQKDTALHWAVKYRHPNPTTEALIEAGVPINAKDSKGHTALYYASVRHDRESAEILRAHGGIWE